MRKLTDYAASQISSHGPLGTSWPIHQCLKRMARYLALAGGERKLLRKAVVYLALSTVGEKLLPFSWLIRTIGLRRTRWVDLTETEIRQVARAVESAARGLPLRIVCLHKGLATCWMLQALGSRPNLHYGVSATSDGFHSHVWVELAGKAVIGHQIAGSYTTLTIFPNCQPQ